MAAPGMCTLTDNQCAIDTFCPATDETVVACQPCETITEGNSCVCKNNKLQLDCKSCNGIFCNECIKGQAVAFGASCRHCMAKCLECSNVFKCDVCEPGYFFNGKICETCRIDFCDTCSDATTCTGCQEGNMLVGKSCVTGCKTTADCTEPSTYCDIKTSSCQYCAEGCDKCDNPETCSTCQKQYFLNSSDTCTQCELNCEECTSTTCASCYPGFSPKGTECIERCHTTSDCVTKPAFCNNTVCKECVPGCEECSNTNYCYKCKEGMFMNALANCEVECPELKNGQFCQNGIPKPCVEGLTSVCKCEEAANCANCSPDGKSCATCYPGFVMDNGLCQPCSRGYDWYEGLCLKRDYVPVYASNGATSTIAGAAVAGFIVAAGVCGGLAFYLTRKYRNNYVQVNAIAE